MPSNTCRAADAVSADMSGRWHHTSHNMCQAWTAACAGVGQQSTGTELARPPLPHLSSFRHSVTSCPTVTVRCRALRGSVGGSKAKRGGLIDHRAPAPWQGRPRRRSAQSARFATSPFTVSLARTRNLMAICSFTLPQGAGLASAELGRPWMPASLPRRHANPAAKFTQVALQAGGRPGRTCQGLPQRGAHRARLIRSNPGYSPPNSHSRNLTKPDAARQIGLRRAQATPRNPGCPPLTRRGGLRPAARSAGAPGTCSWWEALQRSGRRK